MGKGGGGSGADGIPWDEKALGEVVEKVSRNAQRIRGAKKKISRTAATADPHAITPRRAHL